MTEDKSAKAVRSGTVEVAAEPDGSGDRVAPSTRVALVVVGVYIGALTVVNGVGRLVVDEVEVGSFHLDGTSGVALVGAVAIVAVALTAFAVWSGWWRHIWRDPDRAPRARWLLVVPLVIPVQVLVALSLGASTEHTVGYLVLAVALCALVGYTEELLFRGLLVLGLRASMMSDVRVLVISSAVFAVAHAANFAFVMSIAVVGQILVAFVLGAALYLALRVTRLLAVPMVLHAAVDLGMLVAGKPPSRVVLGSYSVMIIAMAILVPIAARRLPRGPSAVAPPSLLGPPTAAAEPTTALE